MNIQNHIQLRAFARNDGTWLGLLWIVSFACVAWGTKVHILGTFGTALAFLTPFFVFRRIQAFRDVIREGLLSYWGSFAYSLAMFFYGALLLTLVQYAYFAYIDNGEFFGQSLEQAREIMIAANYPKKEVNDAIAEYQSMRPIDWALYFMTMNIIVGALTSIVIALLTYRTKKVAKE